MVSLKALGFFKGQSPTALSLTHRWLEINQNKEWKNILKWELYSGHPTDEPLYTLDPWKYKGR